MPTTFQKLDLTTPVAAGDDVRAAQHALKENRFGNFHPGKTDGHYGDHTAAATRRAKYWLGFRKAAWTGAERFAYGHKLHRTLIGERKLTMLQRRRRAHRLRLEEKNGVGLDALRVAKTQLGTKESPPDSNNVKYNTWYYGHPVSGSSTYPWCCVFVSWCFANSQPFYRWRKPNVHYAYVPALVNDARAGRNGLSVVSKTGVRPGDLVCFDWPGESPGLADHIGFFDGWVNQTSGSFKTVEGNTALTDNSNGGEVMARQRSLSLVQVFVRVTATGDAV